MKEHDETEHLLSTEANKERLLEDVFNDEKRQGVKELIDKHKLEEAAERLYPTDYGEKSKNIINIIKLDAFVSGAKWQQERSYSEQEVVQLLQNALTHQDDGEIGSLVTHKNTEINQPTFENNLQNAKDYFVKNNFEFFSNEQMNIIGKTMVGYANQLKKK